MSLIRIPTSIYLYTDVGILVVGLVLYLVTSVWNVGGSVVGCFPR